MTDNQMVAMVANRVAKKFCQTPSLRGFSSKDQLGRVKSYTLDLELVNIDGTDWLQVQTWGYDYEEIRVPQSRPELIRRKTLLQITERPNGADKLFLRYCLEVLRAVDQRAL